MKNIVLLICLLFGFANTEMLSEVLYVNSNAIGNNNGKTWKDAFTNIENAIEISKVGDHIWVAKGEYPKISNDKVIKVLNIKKGLVIFGGFDGTEKDNFDVRFRDLKSNISKINCEIKLLEDSLSQNIHFPTFIDGFLIEPPTELTQNINPEYYYTGIIAKNCTFDFANNIDNSKIVSKQKKLAMGRILIKYKNNSEALKSLRENKNIQSIEKVSSTEIISKKFNLQKQQKAYIELKNKEFERSAGIDRWYILDFSENSDIEAIAEQYRNDENIEEVTFDYTAQPHLVPNDSYYYTQWGHNNSAQLPSYNTESGQHDGSVVGTVGFDSDLEAAYSTLSSYGDAAVIIGIIDSGVDLDHPDLQNNLVTGYDFGSNDSDPDDVTGHGTACAGIAAAKANNGIGIAGVAGNCKIMPLKVANQQGTMYFSAIQNAIYYAADNGADIINMSLGNNSISSEPATDLAIQYAHNAGVIIIASSGNANATTVEYPASNQYVIAVGAASPCGERKSTTTCDGENWWGSNYGTDVQDGRGSVDVIAPTIIPATDIVGASGYSSGDYFLYFNGTSAASPFAAGVCAIIKSAHPTWTPSQIRQQLILSSTDITGGEASVGWDRFTGYGMINAQEALIMEPPTNYPPVFTATGPFTIRAGSAEGTEVGDINSHNGDGGGNDGGISYSITVNLNSDSDGNNAFAINSATGVITVNDAGDLDYDVNPIINITVRADDGLAHTDANVTIYLSPSTAKIIYVASDASGLNDGTSWANAYTNLQTALGAAVAGDSIFVKYGNYKPTVPDGNRDISFNIPSGVAVIGHFAGTETASWQRVLTNDTYETTLSGDLNGNDIEFTNNSENSKIVVKFTNVSSLTLLDGFTISHGKSDGGGGAGIFNNGGGGSNSSNPTISHCKIEFNSGATYGAGIYNESYGSSISSTPVINYCTFYRNNTYGGGLGGAIYNSECSPSISNCYFERNFAIEGAAIFNSGWCFGNGGATITNCVFYDHISFGTWDTQIFDVLTTFRGTISIDNCLFNDNHTNSLGVIFNYFSDIDIENSIFTNNSQSTYGGGGAAINSDDGTTNIDRCTFENNIVNYLVNSGTALGLFRNSWPGGAIYTNGTTLNLTNSTFKGNKSGSFGGAVFTSGDDAFISNCIFTGNYSGESGGAICFNSNNAASVINCTISGNYAFSDGDDVYINNPEANNGGGIYAYNCNPAIKNSIIWGNKAETNGDEIYNVSSTPAISFSNIRNCGNSGASWDLSLGSDGGNNISSYPYFEDYIIPENTPNILGNYRLLANSACIDAGNNSYMILDYDLDSNARVQNGIIDLGAYEGSHNKVIFVNHSAAGSETGMNWATAYTDLQDAISATNVGDRIYVAAGTYKPGSGSNSRSSTFAFPSDVKVYGHFAGTEDNYIERDTLTNDNETILSGDIGTVGVDTDNAYHVVTFSNTSEETLLDRFTITQGYANGSSSDSRGGAVLCNSYGNSLISNCNMNDNFAVSGGAVSIQSYSLPVFNYCTFEDNQATNGGAIYLYLNSYGNFNHCNFLSNTSISSGGAIYNNTNSKIELNYCKISGNSVNQYGGGLFQSNAEATLNNCIISGNFANLLGGAIRNNENGSVLNINNSTIVGNKATNGGSSIYNYIGSILVKNSIIWGNSTTGGVVNNVSGGTTNYEYSNIQGSGGSASWDSNFGTDGGNNMDLDPKFKLLMPYSSAPTTNGDYDILVGSACSNAGSNALVPEDIDFDMNGDARIQNSTVDIGAYEGAKNRLKIYVSNTASGLNNGYNWEHAFNDLQDAINISSSTDSIYVKSGTYKPNSSDRTSTFSVYNTNRIYGHFAGTEDNSSERDLENPAYETILSGDIGTEGVDTDNCYHVVTYISTTGGGGETLFNKVWMDGLTISDGYANGGGDNSLGGGIYNKPGFNFLNNELYLTNSKITNNYAAYGGGGICLNSSSPEGIVYNVRITGGAIDNCIITNNTTNSTNGNGGGIFVKASRGGYNRTEIINSTISENTAYDGGGICIDGNNGSFLILSKIENCFISGNTATHKGGGIYCDFQTNVSDPTPLINSVISGNTATSYGGGVYYVSSLDWPSTSYITNCTFIANKSSETNGSAIFSIRGNTLLIRNSVFWGHDNTASHIFSSDCNTCAEWDDEDDWEIIRESSRIHYYNNDVQGSGGSSSWEAAFGVDEGNNIDSNPLFTDLPSYSEAPTTDGDFTFSGSSPLINAGNNTYVTATTDIAGNNRIDVGTVDIGAYESQNCINPTGGNTITGAQTICHNTQPNEITNVTLPTGYGGILEYKWQKSTTSDSEGFTDISETNSQNYSPLAITQTTWFKRLARVQCKADWTGARESNIIEITVIPEFNPGIIESAGETMCAGNDPAVIGSFSPASGGDGVYTYKWQVSIIGANSGFEDIASTNALTYDPPSGITQDTWYRRLAKDNTCNTEFTPTDEVWEIHIPNDFSAGFINTNGETICYYGNPGVIYNSVSANGGDRNITYKWQKSTTSDSDGFSDIDDSNIGSYNPPSGLTQTTWYRRYAKDGSCNPDFTLSTGVWQVVVLPQFTTGSINTNGETICYNDDPAEIGSAIAASGGDNSITYQWELSTTNSTSGFNAISSSNSASYNPPSGLTQTTWYRRLAKDETCNATLTHSTGVWQVTVNSEFTTGAINTTGETICYNGDPAEIGSAIASSGGDNSITYQWELSTTNSTSGFNSIALSNIESYNPPSGLTQTTWYRRLAKDNTCNSSFTASTGVWQVNVRPEFAAGSIADIGETICYNGDPSTIISALAASGGDGTITYQWELSTTNSTSGFTSIPSSNSATYNPPNGMIQTTWYRRKAKDGTCNTTPTHSTGVWQVTVRPQFNSGVIDTKGEILCNNSDPIEIGSVTAASGGDELITYQWELSTTNSTSGFFPIVNSSGETYDPPSGLTETTWYRRKAKDGSCNNSLTLSTGVWKITVPPSTVWVDNSYNEETNGWGVTHFSNLGIALANLCDNSYVYIAPVSITSYIGDVDFSGLNVTLGDYDLEIKGNILGGLIKTTNIGKLTMKDFDANSTKSFPITDGVYNYTVTITTSDSNNPDISIKINNNNPTGSINSDFWEIEGPNNLNATITFRVDKDAIAPKTLNTNSQLRYYNGTRYVPVNGDNFSIEEFDEYYIITLTSVNEF